MDNTQLDLIESRIINRNQYKRDQIIPVNHHGI